jgi:hypothetical protein
MCVSKLYKHSCWGKTHLSQNTISMWICGDWWEDNMLDSEHFMQNSLCSLITSSLERVPLTALHAKILPPFRNKWLGYPYLAASQYVDTFASRQSWVTYFWTEVVVLKVNKLKSSSQGFSYEMKLMIIW